MSGPGPTSEPHVHAPDEAADHDHGPDESGLRGKLRHLFTPHSHDPAAGFDSALESSEKGVFAVKVSLAALLITAVLQLVLVWLTSSTALLADTIHNFSDALTSVPLWIAFVIGRRAANRQYTYGYGRAEDLAGLFVVAMIAFSAVLVAWESFQRLFEPAEISNLWLVAAAGVIGFIGNELVAVYRIRVGHEIGSQALVADGLHARTDGLTSIAVVIAAVGRDRDQALHHAEEITSRLRELQRDGMLRLFPASAAISDSGCHGANGGLWRTGTPRRRQSEISQ